MEKKKKKRKKKKDLFEQIEEVIESAKGDKELLRKNLVRIEKLNKTGKLIFEIVERFPEIRSLDNICDIIIRNDKMEGAYCFFFLRDFVDKKDFFSIEKLTDAIVEKDNTGYWCYHTIKECRGKISLASITKLENAIIEKDSTGEICYWLLTLNEDEIDATKVAERIKELAEETGNERWLNYIQDGLTSDIEPF